MAALRSWIRAGFQTLVDAGYAPEMPDDACTSSS
ncbi:MAG: hypothetical protein R2724_27400 [Bryobacterales bacterium]